MLNTDNPSSNTQSTARPSRLRGLSYLRTHLHSSSSSASASATTSTASLSRQPNRPQFGRTESFPLATPTSPPLLSPTRAVNTFPDLPTPSGPSQAAAQSSSNTDLGSRRRSSLGDLESSGDRVRTRSRSSTNPVNAMAPDVAAPPASADLTPLPSSNPPPPPQSSLPSIQLIPHQDPRVTRPSLAFTAITRTLPGDNSIVRVGRYSEKDTPTENAPTGPSDAPVGFKSKVVSRRHCEFFYSAGQWYVKDVKSSSGTFLNHIRLSQPGVESKPFPVNDGDIVQLGIDFKGGEEMIFRCVKIRVALNRGWQKELNTFNKSAIKRLREMAKSSEAGTKNSTECTICLSPIAPIQALFVAPCSHTWHYKCVRTILNGGSYPQFICPNCRAVTDLNADVDIDFDEWEASEDEQSKEDGEPKVAGAVDELAGATGRLALDNAAIDDTLTVPATSLGGAGIPSSLTSSHRVISSVSPSNPAQSMNIPMPAGFSTGRRTSVGLSREEAETGGPMTPSNDAGPFIYG